MSDSDSRPVPDAKVRRGLRLVSDETEATAGDEGRLRALASRAQAKLRRSRQGMGSLRTDVPVLLRLLGAFVQGDYRRIPWRALLLAVGALVYFVTPADLIPDVIVGTGLLDDAAVVAYVLSALRGELAEFELWEAENALEDPDTLSPPY